MKKSSYHDLLKNRAFEVSMSTGSLCGVVIGLLAIGQSLFALAIINQTDSMKMIEIEEAYRPASDKPGDLAAPLSLGYGSQTIQIAAHSVVEIRLRAPCKVLLVSVVTETKKGNETITSKMATCYEPYIFQNHKEEYFNDSWGFVIHKPVGEQRLSLLDSDYMAKKMAFESEKRQGYGIKCLHPLLLLEVTSLEELPEELKSHIAGAAPLSKKKS